MHRLWYNEFFVLEQAYDLATFESEKESCISGESDSASWKGAFCLTIVKVNLTSASIIWK